MTGHHSLPPPFLDNEMRNRLLELRDKEEYHSDEWWRIDKRIARRQLVKLCARDEKPLSRKEAIFLFEGRYTQVSLPKLVYWGFYFTYMNGYDTGSDYLSEESETLEYKISKISYGIRDYLLRIYGCDNLTNEK